MGGLSNVYDYMLKESFDSLSLFIRSKLGGQKKVKILITLVLNAPLVRHLTSHSMFYLDICNKLFHKVKKDPPLATIGLSCVKA